jgi:hypothetical protein
VLLIFQAMDAAGKDGAIKHVMSGVNPQGCQVASFKGPSAQDLDHDYLWRCQSQLPERGRIGIFNRSITKRCWSCACTPRSWRSRRSRRPSSARTCSRIATATSAPSSVTWAATDPRPQVLPPRLPQGAEAAFPRAARGPGEELEVLGQRPRRARVLEGLHEGVRRDDPQHGHARRPLVRGARGQQVVHPRGRRGSRGRRAGLPRPRIPKVGKRQLAELGKAREALRAEK